MVVPAAALQAQSRIDALPALAVGVRAKLPAAAAGMPAPVVTTMEPAAGIVMDPTY